MGKTFISVEVTEKGTLVKMNGKASELTALIACAVQTIANNGGKSFNGVMDNVMFTLEKIHKAETKGKLIEGIVNGMNYIEDNIKGNILERPLEARLGAKIMAYEVFRAVTGGELTKFGPLFDRAVAKVKNMDK